MVVIQIKNIISIKTLISIILINIANVFSLFLAFHESLQKRLGQMERWDEFYSTHPQQISYLLLLFTRDTTHLSLTNFWFIQYLFGFMANFNLNLLFPFDERRGRQRKQRRWILWSGQYNILNFSSSKPENKGSSQFYGDMDDECGWPKAITSFR